MASLFKEEGVEGGGWRVVPAAAGPVRGMDVAHVRPCEDFIIVVQCFVPTCPPSYAAQPFP